MVDVTAVTSGHDVADARLHRQVAALRRAGATVEVLGLGDPAGAPRGAAVRTWPRAGLTGRAWLALRLPWLARGRVLLALDPDVLIGCALVRAARRRRVVADVHEDYASLLRDRRWARGWVGRVASAVVAAATTTAARADLTVVADAHVPPTVARRRWVLRNLPDRSFLPAPGPREEAPRAVYVGDVRRTRGLFTMLEVLRRAPDWHLDVVGPVAPADQDRLDDELSADEGLRRRVRLHGRQDPLTAWRLAEGAWGGLLLLDDTPAFREALPSKLYEYLACGLAVVATDLPRQSSLLEESGGGVVVHDAEQAARVLTGWAQDPAPLDEMRRRARDWADRTLDADGYTRWATAVVDLSR